ncbi:hypothetical protein T4D_5429 [Trichinella pseudospiralis]|uniref:Uncharacterized protein n=1 Tax=Trichinella pseudospiralis TaxID=6337 RepID=A0A0V1D7C3_TRIPS|nr:hypothetical protein T4D_5429 [Trichinella pseudospiralis]
MRIERRLKSKVLKLCFAEIIIEKRGKENSLN